MFETLVIRLRAAEDAPASWLIVDRMAPARAPSRAARWPMHRPRRRVGALRRAARRARSRWPNPSFRCAAARASRRPCRSRSRSNSPPTSRRCTSPSARASRIRRDAVAMVARSQLDRWLPRCEAAGIHPDAAYAESTALPATPGGCTLLLDEGMLYVCRADGVPFVLDASPLAAALDLALGDGRRAGRDTSRSTPRPAEYERHATPSRACARAPRRCRSSCCRTARCRCSRRRRRPAPAINLLQGTVCGALFASARRCASGACPRHSPPHGVAFVGEQGLVLAAAPGREGARRADRRDLAQALPGQTTVDPRAQMQGVLGARGAAAERCCRPCRLLAQAIAQAPARGSK